MKKLICTLFIMLLFFSGCILAPLTAYADETKAASSEEKTDASETETEAPSGPVILPTDKVSTEDIILYSSAACVMDVDTGEILYYKNMDDRHYPASITKVMTGLLLIENADLDDTITFSQDCWNGLNYYNDMNIGMLNGEELTVNDALHAILMSSANEVCNGAAKYLSGSVSAFCDLMNERAKQLGCTNTHFVNPNGLHDPEHYTSAHDMALIAKEAIQNPTFREITGCKEYTVKSTNLRPEGFTLYHKHQMLMDTKYHYDACIGGKTGYTSEAKNTLVTYAEKNDHTLVSVVMENSDGHIYPDTISAMDYCFDNYDRLVTKMAAAETTAETESSTFSHPGETENLPAFAELTETESDSEMLPAADDYSNGSPLSIYLHKMVNFALEHIFIALLCVICTVILLSLFMIWLYHVLKRRKHRRNYERLRDERIKKYNKNH